MKKSALAALLLGASASLAPAQTLLLLDNFDVADTTNFDNAPLTGRLTGTLASVVQLRSSRVQQDIVGMQLSMLKIGGSGRIRFHEQANLGVWYDWASGPSGTDILNGSGFTVEFDWTPGGDTSGDWVSMNVGIDGQGVGEPGVRVNHAGTDIGILFRDNGATERFDNGANRGAGGSFPNILTARHVVLEYSFLSFADGSNVDVVASVDGVEVINEAWDWNNNLGALYMELGNLAAGTLIDNFQVSNLAAPTYGIDLDNDTFGSWLLQGGLVGTLSASVGVNPDPSTFTFVAGAGDTDNGKFQITGDSLEIGTFDFTGANSSDGQQFAVRVRGDSDGSAAFEEIELLLTITKDDDVDGLIDDWEILATGNITDLTGLLSGPGPGVGTGDLDGDTLTDLEEYQLSLGTFLPGLPAYPGINPNSADTDGDTLSDVEELFPTGLRFATAPDNDDTDFDGLSDLVESGTFAFVDANDTGTDPTDPDFDDDGSRDGWELDNGGDLYDPAVFPASVSPSVAVVRITEEHTSGISTGKTYTHAISGGATGPGHTVNGVFFDSLTPTVTPANFTWDTLGNSKNEIPLASGNLGDWNAAAGGVTGQGLLDLLGGFSYSGNGAGPNSMQRYTLSGLTAGESYILRLYIRVWDTEGSGRPIDLTFTNGAEVVTPFGALPEDRPGTVLGTFEDQQAYFLSFAYTADGTELLIDANIHPAAMTPSGSYHLYGLTNEVAGTPAFAITIDDTGFVSGNLQGELVGTLSGLLDAVPESSTFALVPGAGDTDNAKFQIVGDELQVGSFDFTGANSVDGQQFVVRVQGTGPGGVMDEREFVLTVSKDDDNDQLPDAWELAWAANLTDLSGVGLPDFDGDLLADSEEYGLSLGTLAGLPAYPNIDPTALDTDGDTLPDGEEVFPTGFRPPTDPTNPDSDGDGLSDGVETNTLVFNGPNDTGSNPTLVDTDGDTASDFDEVGVGSDPSDPLSLPPLPDGISLVQLTDDASATIDSAKTYTHAISGGTAELLNGVLFEQLSPTVTPANFSWDTDGNSKNNVLNNNGDWIPASGGVTGQGIQFLLRSFTYSGNGTADGAMQTFTLSGLTPGQAYEFRLYVRIWSFLTVREIDLKITNGTEVADPLTVLPEDRPGLVLGNGNDHSAYYIAFNYVAQGTELVLEMDVAAGGNASFHMYGLSNEETVNISAPIVITNVQRAPGGQIVINFSATPDTTYVVTKSADLMTFGDLDIPLIATTDFMGDGQAVIPASEASELQEFYRIEE